MLKWKQPRGENADHSTDWSAKDADRRGKNREETAKWEASVRTAHELNHLMFISVFRKRKLSVPEEPRTLRKAQERNWKMRGIWTTALCSALLIQLTCPQRKPDHKRKSSPRGCRTARTGAGWAAARGGEHAASLHGCMWDEKRCGHSSPQVITPLIIQRLWGQTGANSNITF